jgi:hypothetical protein
LKIEVKKKIDVIFDCRMAQERRKVIFRVETQSQSWKKDIGAMRKHLDVSGFERHKNNFQNAKLQARKKISAMV